MDKQVDKQVDKLSMCCPPVVRLQNLRVWQVDTLSWTGGQPRAAKHELTCPPARGASPRTNACEPLILGTARDFETRANRQKR